MCLNAASNYHFRDNVNILDQVMLAQMRCLRKIAKNAISFTDTKYLVKFLNNYAEQHAIYLPGRSTSAYNTNLKPLPYSDRKNKNYDIYGHPLSVGVVEKPVSLRVFTNISRETCSKFVVMKPKSNLCSFSQEHFSSGVAIVLASEENKTKNEGTPRTGQKLESLTKIKTTKNSLDNPQEKSIHYSFDMAQKVHILCNPLQSLSNLFVSAV